jgi:hypothetical protein
MDSTFRVEHAERRPQLLELSLKRRKTRVYHKEHYHRPTTSVKSDAWVSLK